MNACTIPTRGSDQGDHLMIREASNPALIGYAVRYAR